MAKEKRILEIVNTLQKAGGTSYYVGGYCRDLHLGLSPKDIDIEIHGLSYVQVERILSKYGEIDQKGKSFGVYKIKNFDVDFSLPRKESKYGPGHKDFQITFKPLIGIEEALRRRDFTINAIATNIATNETIDPFGGKRDLEDKTLRVVDPKTFVEDPLRVLRGAQFCARFGLKAAEETLTLSKGMRGTYNSLPKERVFGELKKLLTASQSPSIGIQFLKDADWLEYWPELNNLWGIPQDPGNHPEGSVECHILEAVDRAAWLKDLVCEEDRLIYMLACLLHDIGKYTHTFYRTEPKKLRHWKEKRPKNSRIVTYGHDSAGIEPAKRFLERITEDKEILCRVPRLVGFHMKPLLSRGWKPKAYRKIAKEGCEMRLIGIISWADKGKKNSDWFHTIEKLTLNGPKETCIGDRDLIDRGYREGEEVGKIIQRCEDIFIKTGITDPEELLRRAKASRMGRHRAS